MNPDPITAKRNQSHEELIALMEKNQILALPITDKNKVIGIKTFQSREHKKVTEYENPVFIMAGGFGTRLQPLTDNCPKPMLKIHDKPILQITIERFIDQGFNEFIISLHYLPEHIRNYFGDGKDWGVNISYVDEPSPLGTGGSLGLIKNRNLSLPLVVINGDILTTLDFTKLVEFHKNSKAEATMCVREYEFQIPYGVIESKGDRIIDIFEKPIQKIFVNAGIYILNPKILESIKENIFLDLPDLLKNNIANKQKVFMFPIHEYWADIGSHKDFTKVQQDYRTIK